MTTQINTFKNGLKVIFVNTQSTSLTTMLLVGAGSRYETKENNGIAHFFEHMAFKGSKKYPSSFIISSTIEGLGGIFNAFTSKDHTGYWIKSTPEHFFTVLDVIADMVQNPLLEEEEIEREKGVIIEEINMYEDNPQRKVFDLFDNLIFPDHPLGYDIAGKKEIVSRFNRQTFINYINKLYKPENSILVLAGNLERLKKENLLSVIEEKFSLWQGKKTTEFLRFEKKQEKPAVFLKSKNTEQTHFCLGFRTFSFSEEKKYPLKILSTILGGGMSSRLFIEVRERRGLCYYISSFDEAFADTGYYVIHAGVTNKLEQVKEAIKVILQEHQKVIQGKIKKEDFQRAKEMIKGQLLLYLENTVNLASYFGTKQLLMNKIEDPEEVIKKITSIKLDQVIELAKEIFKPENLNLALIGPYESREEFEKSLVIKG